MGKQLVGVFLVAAFGLAMAETVRAQPDAIAHWTFDSGHITTNGGNIATADDVASGAHDATARVLGTGATLTSVPGQFGEAVLFTNASGGQAANNASFEFPQVTEIMGASAGSFSVSAWVKTTQTLASNTVFADWGTAPSGNRFTYWFSLPNTDGSTTSRPRGQLRASNSPNDDIVAFTLPTPNDTGVDNVADDAWHHVVWVWDKPSAVLTTYIDGMSHAAPVAAPPVDLLLSDSAVGTIGAKRDTNNYFIGGIDELWLFDSALTAEEVTELKDTNFGVPTNLSIEINTTNGQVTLRNTTENSIAFSSYRVTSPGNSLDVAGWDRISTGTPVVGFPQGNGSGNGWEAGPNPSSGEVVEWYLTGDSSLAAAGAISLGNLYNEGVDAEDLRFQYTLADGTLKTGFVEYVMGPGGVAGDYNENGVVDAADYTVWRDNLGSVTSLPNDDTPGVGADDYTRWKTNFGNTSGSGAAAGSAVPEPFTVWMLLFGCGTVGAACRRRGSRCL